MSGVVVEVRVKEGQEIKKGDPLCGKCIKYLAHLRHLTTIDVISSQRHEGKLSPKFMRI